MFSLLAPFRLLDLFRVPPLMEGGPGQVLVTSDGLPLVTLDGKFLVVN